MKIRLNLVDFTVARDFSLTKYFQEMHSFREKVFFMTDSSNANNCVLYCDINFRIIHTFSFCSFFYPRFFLKRWRHFEGVLYILVLPANIDRISDKIFLLWRYFSPII
jgi:hypothetical protein